MTRATALSRKRGKKTPDAAWRSLRPAVTPELLEGVVQRIAERFHPERVILFGSYAWGEPDLDSDIDLLVIMESEEPLIPRIRRVRAAARVEGLPMDVIVRTPDEVRERMRMGDTFMAEILDKGVPLYDRGGRVGSQGRSRLPVGDRPPAPTT